MKLRCFLLLLGLVAFQGCDEKEAPLPVAFFTATASQDYLNWNGHDHWLFATDDAGKVLDAQPLVANVPVTLATPGPPELFNLTVYFNNGANPLYHEFRTYAGLARGAEIALGLPEFSTYPPNVGSATIIIENCSPYTHVNISDGISIDQTNSYENGYASRTIALYQASSKILVSTRKAIDQPVYAWLENVVSSSTRTLDMNTLSPFPKTLSVSHRGYMTASIVGHETDNDVLGYVMTGENFEPSWDAPEVVELGYLDGFDSYSLVVSSGTGLPMFQRTTSYTGSGTDIPSQVTLPDNTMSIADRSIANFTFTYSAPYTYRVHEWQEWTMGSHVITWRIYSGNELTPRITEVPPALLAKYPTLSTSRLSHYSSTFSNHIDGYTYAQFLDERFGAQPPATSAVYTDNFVVHE